VETHINSQKWDLKVPQAKLKLIALPDVRSDNAPFHLSYRGTVLEASSA
jgi:hypothetical protein